MNKPLTQKEKMRMWRELKKQDGWLAVCMFVPPESAEELKQLKRKFKFNNTHLYKRI